MNISVDPQISARYIPFSESCGITEDVYGYDGDDVLLIFQDGSDFN
jgi:hypothetical protein